MKQRIGSSMDWSSAFLDLRVNFGANIKNILELEGFY